jgi:hypothetical protein
MLILNKARSLSEIELDLIEKYTGHTHFDEIGKVTCKIEPEYNKYPAEQPIEYYYNLVESYNPLRELANKTYQNSDENNSSEEKLAKFLKHAFSEHQNKSRFFRADIDKLNANKNISEEDKQKLTHESSSKKPNHKH